MSGVGSIPGLANGYLIVFFDVTIGGHDAGRIKMDCGSENVHRPSEIGGIKSVKFTATERNIVQ